MEKRVFKIEIEASKADKFLRYIRGYALEVTEIRKEDKTETKTKEDKTETKTKRKK